MGQLGGALTSSRGMSAAEPLATWRRLKTARSCPESEVGKSEGVGSGGRTRAELTKQHVDHLLCALLAMAHDRRDELITEREAAHEERNCGSGADGPGPPQQVHDVEKIHGPCLHPGPTTIDIKGPSIASAQLEAYDCGQEGEDKVPHRGLKESEGLCAPSGSFSFSEA